jgi:hypothetical protein
MDSLDGFRMIPGLVRIDLFSTAYWFVPNLMIAVSVLLLCRRFLYDPRLGCALLGLSLFYGVNAYSQWIPIQNHSEAFLGFAFYLWLGAWTAKHFAAFMAWIARIPLLALLVLAVLTGLAAFGEAEVLTDRGAMNTLRISNQIYSVLAVLAIFKARGGLWPRAAQREGKHVRHLSNPFCRAGPVDKPVEANPASESDGQRRDSGRSLCDRFAAGLVHRNLLGLPRYYAVAAPLSVFVLDGGWIEIGGGAEEDPCGRSPDSRAIIFFLAIPAPHPSSFSSWLAD